MKLAAAALPPPTTPTCDCCRRRRPLMRRRRPSTPLRRQPSTLPKPLAGAFGRGLIGRDHYDGGLVAEGDTSASTGAEGRKRWLQRWRPCGGESEVYEVAAVSLSPSEPGDAGTGCEGVGSVDRQSVCNLLGGGGGDAVHHRPPPL